MTYFSPSRRKFLKVSAGIAGSALVIGINWGCDSAREQEKVDEENTFSPNAWLKLDNEGGVTVIVAESEMGQGPYTLMPMMIAEELEVNWSQILVERAPSDPIYGYQLTGGSSSIRKGWGTLREAGAITRTLMVESAAQHFKVSSSECSAFEGKVFHEKSGREIGYKDLIQIASELPMPTEVSLKNIDDFKIIGQPLPRKDVPNKINGKARFGIDIKLPNMLYASIIHCPVFGGKVKRIDSEKAKKIKGVHDIFQINEGVAVVGKDTWTTFKASSLIDIEWDTGKHQNTTTESLIDDIKNTRLGKIEPIWEQGNLDQKQDKVDKLITANYLQPLQAHVPLEPMNCTAHFDSSGNLDVWVPTQSPSEAYKTAKRVSQSKLERGIKKAQKKYLGIHDDSIRIHTTLIGGGFGRRLNQDYVAEVVQIAERYDRPVQLVWTREEDVQHDFYHPMTYHSMTGGLNSEGLPILWDHLIAGYDARKKGAISNLYNITNSRVQLLQKPYKIPKGSWRSVDRHYNVFAVEHFFDELSLAGNHDPVELRLKMVSDSRLRNVLETAVNKSRWGLTDDSVSFGVALIHEWGTYVAQVLELHQIRDNQFNVKKVTCAIDCGIVINPDIVKQQMEGSIVFGLSAAIKSKISINKGRVEQSNYHDYPILRFDETPQIETIIIDSVEEPGGIGEPAVPPVAPALANAILQATGKPVRELPVKL